MGGFQQRPWTPTKRRGQIAAEFNGPGPASVSLPSYIGNDNIKKKKKLRTSHLREYRLRQFQFHRVPHAPVNRFSRMKKKRDIRVAVSGHVVGVESFSRVEQA